MSAVYNEDFADRIVLLCFEKYNKLPKTGKPNINESQWSLLSGICLEEDGNLSVVALGTGTKCLGITSYSKNGDVVHDSHAEVLTRRAWLRYLYSQMSLCISGQPSIFNSLPVETVNKYRNSQTEKKTFEQDMSKTCRANSDKTPGGNQREIVPENDSKYKNCVKVESKDEESVLSNDNTNKHINNNDNDDSSQTTSNIGIPATQDSLDFNFTLRAGVKFHFYTSHTPCGDASIFPRHIKATTLARIQTQSARYKVQKDFLKRRKLATVVTQEKILCKKPRVDEDLASESQETVNIDSSSEDSEAEDSLSGDVGSMVQDFHRTGAKTLPHASHKDPRGTGPEFHLMGVPRIKPGRGDPTYSMSCSDKIAKWNAVGWEGSLISTLLSSPIYMSSITVGGGIAISTEALQRALITRVSHLLPSPSPVLLHSQVVFPAGKRSVKREMKRLGRPICTAHPVAGCIIWCNVTYKPLEVAIEGIRQGVSRKIHNKKNGTSSTLLVSSYKLLLQYIQLCRQPQYLGVTYSQMKEKARGYKERMGRCKQALGNWLEVPEEYRQFSVRDMSEKL